MKNIVEIYTDGACSGNPGPGGYGVIIKQNNFINEISEGFLNTTNNKMELLAVIKGLEFLKKPCKNVIIYSDSKYVVNSVTKNWIIQWKNNGWKRKNSQNVKNVDLWTSLLVLLNIHCVIFIWIKGHSVNNFNNRCDFLATQALLKIKNTNSNIY